MKIECKVSVKIEISTQTISVSLKNVAMDMLPAILNIYDHRLILYIIISSVGSLCHTLGVVRRLSSVVRRPSYVVCRLCPP